jgi:hypothetical protein
MARITFSIPFKSTHRVCSARGHFLLGLEWSICPRKNGPVTCPVTYTLRWTGIPWHIRRGTEEEYIECNRRRIHRESQTSLESPFRQRTSRRGNKSTVRHRNRVIDVPNGRNVTGYRVCTGHVESLHVSATIAPPGRSAEVASLCQIYAIPSHYIPQWSIDWIHGC